MPRFETASSQSFYGLAIYLASFVIFGKIVLYPTHRSFSCMGIYSRHCTRKLWTWVLSRQVGSKHCLICRNWAIRIPAFLIVSALYTAAMVIGFSIHTIPSPTSIDIIMDGAAFISKGNTDSDIPGLEDVSVETMNQRMYGKSHKHIGVQEHLSNTVSRPIGYDDSGICLRT